MTLNEIVAGYASSRNRAFDFGLSQKVKLAVKAVRAALIRQDFERNGVNKNMVQYYIEPLIKVDAIDNCVLQIGCSILRTETKVLKPVRLKGGSTFMFVGIADLRKSKTIDETTIAEIGFTAHAKYTKNIPRYIYVNDYIYIVTDEHMKYIMISHIFEQPDMVAHKCADGCADDNDEFPLSIDLLPTVYKMLDEINIAGDNTKDEVKLDEEYETTPAK